MTCIRRKISLVIDKVMGFHSQIVSEVVLKVLIKCRGTTRGIPFKVVKAMISMFCNMVSEVGILGGEHQNSIKTAPHQISIPSINKIFVGCNCNSAM